MSPSEKPLTIQTVGNTRSDSTHGQTHGQNRGQSMVAVDAPDLSFWELFQSMTPGTGAKQASGSVPGGGYTGYEELAAKSTELVDVERVAEESLAREGEPVPSPSSTIQDSDGKARGTQVPATDLPKEDWDFVTHMLAQPDGTQPMPPAFQTMELRDTIAQMKWKQSSSNPVFFLSGKMNQLIQKAHQSGRPIRIAIDDESAIILKIRHGKVSAEFLSSNPALALTLPQQLDELKARLQAKNLPVDDLGYREEGASGDDSGGRDPHQHESDSEQSANSYSAFSPFPQPE